MVIIPCAAISVFAPGFLAKADAGVPTTMEIEFVEDGAGSQMALTKLARPAGKNAKQQETKAYAAMRSKQDYKSNGASSSAQMTDSDSPAHGVSSAFAPRRC